VIPTRERPDTLEVTLATCLAQDFDDYEIVVCDNCSGPETRAVADRVGSDRITYHRVDRPVAMSDNWDLAVSLARGEYITVVGDDDALMPYALRELDRLVVAHDCPEAVHWRRALYLWPTVAVEDEANSLVIPTTRSCELHHGRERLEAASRWAIGADQLPMIYAAVVRRDLVERHREIAGRVFPNIYPDVYSGYAFAYLAERYVSVGVPMGVAGLSSASNGVATLLQDGSSPIAREFHDLNDAAGLHPHPTVPDLQLMPIHPDDCFQHARDLLFPDDPDLVLDRRRMVERYLAAIPDTDPERRAETRAAIRRSLSDRPDLLEWFDTTPDPPPAPPFRLRPMPFGRSPGILAVDASRYGVTDVAGAAALASSLLGLGDGPIDYEAAGTSARSALSRVIEGALRRVARSPLARRGA
jgi:glycosyl transferase family 2